MPSGEARNLCAVRKLPKQFYSATPLFKRLKPVKFYLTKHVRSMVLLNNTTLRLAWMIRMDTNNTGTGALIVKRIEELLHKSSLPPETVLNIMRAAQANPDYDPLRELERLQSEQRHTE
jgi:hypothetical protein